MRSLKLIHINWVDNSRLLNRQTRLLQNNLNPAIGQHVGNPIFRIRRVNRHIRGARLQHGQQANDHLQRPLHHDRYQRLWLCAKCNEVMG